MIKQLLVEVRRRQQAEHQLHEQTKLGVYRVGSSGVVVAGQSYGQCPRQAHLRALGVEGDKTDTDLLTFESGYASEDKFMQTLTAAWTDETKSRSVQREEECPVEFEAGGHRVTGRPDGLLLKAGVPVYGVECKAVLSMWKAIKVHYDLKPDTAHLIQAGIYSHCLGVPWSIVYSARCQYHLSTAPAWLQAKFQQGVYDVEWKGTEPFKTSVFEREYLLTWEDGHLCYETVGLDKVKTLMTWESVLAFYQQVSDVPTSLPPRPTKTGIDGKSTYKACDYCEFKPQCDNYESNYEVWVDHITSTKETV